MRALLRSLGRLAAPKPVEPAEIEIAGNRLPVYFRRMAQARRIVVRLGRDGRSIAVTLPRRASRAEALAFVEGSREWIARRLAGEPGRVALAPGATVPLRGVPHEIVHRPAARGTVTAIDGKLFVHGEPKHIPRRLREWFAREARRDLARASARHAAAMQAAVRRIAIRDQKSRWGSCAASGNLSYSWRLILAPPHVLDYVAAHEVAHLRQLNHGPAFWRLVLSHCPEAAEAKRWLKRHGAELHRYG